ncbi:hypothetical protein B0J13DRAFT_560399 [Dactylonectria estremocensis]|uniref:Uncharacterized protein n=1 Tax=Dactylonectria estremocensis TaxID=1079267 RepID=A0A9P9IVF6_9HYPO|nr:hypothetical protein B0J13DRAFT_560399 [Dactylonectria estremocensis]
MISYPDSLRLLIVFFTAFGRLFPRFGDKHKSHGTKMVPTDTRIHLTNVVRPWYVFFSAMILTEFKPWICDAVNDVSAHHGICRSQELNEMH